MKKLDRWNNLRPLPFLPAATHWPLFGQQADTFLRALKLGRWATTHTTLTAKIKTTFVTLLDMCLTRSFHGFSLYLKAKLTLRSLVPEEFNGM